MKRKLLSILALFCLTAISAWADGSGTLDDPWTCGGCTVTLVNGTLTISKSASGDGVMEDDYYVQPWNKMKKDITSIIINEGVTHIGDYAFDDANNVNLTSITIPASVTSIGEGAFYYCTNITTITIPSSVTSIGRYAFDHTGWYNNQSDGIIYLYNWLLGYKGDKPTGQLVINEGIIGIAASAFFECEELTGVIIPASVTSICNHAFAESGLTSITLPENMTSIGDNAFDFCENLQEVHIYAPSCSLGVDAFSECINLPYLMVFDDFLPWYRYAQNLSGKNFETIPKSGSCGPNEHKADVHYVLTGTEPNYTLNIIKTGETSAMEDYGISASKPWDFKCNSDNISKVVINEGISHIGNSAFSNLKFVSIAVSIPASVTSIGNNAFYGSTNLTTIILNSNPLIGVDAFPAGTPVTMNLTGNEGETGEYWTTFYNENYNFEVPATTKIFKATLSDASLTLTKQDADQIVTKNNAVILKSTTGPIALRLTATTSSNDFSGNSLQGVNDAAGLTASDPSTTYVLNKKNDVVGFYKLKAGKKLGVGKAYLTYSGAGARDFFGFEETTDIRTANYTNYTDSYEYYDLQGRKVEKPSEGLYIVNGHKVVIK